MRINNYFIDAIFVEDRGTFSQPEIIELNLSFPRNTLKKAKPCLFCIAHFGE